MVPVCNRRDNLELLLASLKIQTLDDFAVAVADDGSTDGTRELVEDLARSPMWRDRLRWIGCGPDIGVRTGRARNIGAANLPSGLSLLVMLDSDLMLPPEAMSRFQAAHREHPNVVLFGMVECHDLWALHVWHPKPPGTMLENQRNLDRYLRAHGEFLRCHAPDEDLEVDVDWGLVALPRRPGWSCRSCGGPAVGGQPRPAAPDRAARGGLAA